MEADSYEVDEGMFLRKIRGTAIWFLKNLFRKLGVGVTSYANLVDLQKRALDSSRAGVTAFRA